MSITELVMPIYLLQSTSAVHMGITFATRRRAVRVLCRESKTEVISSKPEPFPMIRLNNERSGAPDRNRTCT